ncbi:hypothetical protein [Halomonas sp. H5]|uniref:hypothetical protein n=1 Tax=Halomonas sp. H5 TaxID=3423910 RepID=UPI003D362566
MLISDSMPLLWLVYVLLSLVVLVTGYLGIRFLPRLPRLVITAVVAGIIWMPARFSLPLLEEELHTGVAPAIMVAAVAFLQGEGGTLVGALMMLSVGVALGAVVGVLLWRLGRRDAMVETPGEEVPEPAAPRRQEPKIG